MASLLGILGVAAVFVYLYYSSRKAQQATGQGTSSGAPPSTGSESPDLQTTGQETGSNPPPVSGLGVPSNYVYFTVGSVLLADDGSAQGATVKVSGLFMGNPPYVIYPVEATGMSSGPVGAVPAFKFGPVSAAQAASFGNNLSPAYGTVTVTLPGYQTWSGNLRDGGTVVLEPA